MTNESDYVALMRAVTALNIERDALRAALLLTAQAAHELRKEVGALRKEGGCVETGDFEHCTYLCGPEARTALAGLSGSTGNSFELAELREACAKIAEHAATCDGTAHDAGLAIARQIRGIHASDCAMHSEPAYPAGPCDCGALQ